MWRTGATIAEVQQFCVGHGVAFSYTEDIESTAASSRWVLRAIKRKLLVGLSVLAHCASVSATSLSPAHIRAAVDEATKEYLGDFPSDRVIRTVTTDSSRFVFRVPFALELWPPQSFNQIDPQWSKPVSLIDFLLVLDEAYELPYFVFAPAPEATVYCQWVISARGRLTFWDRGDG